MQSLLTILNALDNENRLYILLSLREGELCLCQIIELMQLAPSTVSRHVDLLRQAGLVEMRREGRWRHYRLAGKGATPAAREAIRWILRSLEQEPVPPGFAQRLRQVSMVSPEELTACYSRS